VAVPTLMDRCLALRCPGTAHRGLEHEATLINANDGTALTPGFFLSWGQVCTGHWAMACSSRSRARRSGFCGLHLQRRSRRQMPEGQ
jgi:hypothetical protein